MRILVQPARVAAGLAVAFGLLAATAPATRAESLGEALAAAYRNSAVLEQNRALARAQDENLASAVAALRPVVALSASSAYTNNAVTNATVNTLSLTASMTVFDGKARVFAREAARESVLATRQALRSAEINVLLQAVTAYMDVIRDSESVRLAANNVKVLTEQLQATRDRYEVGEVTATDVSTAEARLEAAKADLAFRQGTLDISREAYRLAVGRYPGKLAAPGSLPNLPASLEAAKALARRNAPAIAQAQHTVKAGEWAVKQARAGLGPTVSASASLSATDAVTGNAATANIALSQTLYAGGALAAAVYRARAQDEANRAALLQAVRTTDQAVAAAWNQLAIANASIAARAKQIRAARVALKGVREEANFGQRTTLDILNAEQELLTAQANLVTARRDQQVAAYTLLAQMGLLTARYLKLKVPLYDPEVYAKATASAPSMQKRAQALDKALKRAGRK